MAGNLPIIPQIPQAPPVVPITQAAKVHQVLTWILEGNSEHTIREAIAETWPGDDSKPLILGAFDSMRTAGSQTHADVQDWCFEATRFLYAKQVEIGDYAGAMRAIRQMQDISATRTKQEPQVKRVEHHHQHEIGVITNANIDEHRNRIALRLFELGDVTRGPAGGRTADGGGHSEESETEISADSIGEAEIE